MPFLCVYLVCMAWFYRGRINTVQVLHGRTERYGREAVQNQQPDGECAAAANDALICPESGDDEGGRGFISLTDREKVRVGEWHPWASIDGAIFRVRKSKQGP